jgi:pimeloyl-ACP methyl ester carboxylesterase
VTKRIEIGEIEVAYDDLGSAGTPLVMIHGFTGHRVDFANVTDALSAGRRVLVPDLRGHGDSGWLGPYGFAALVDDLRRWLDALEVERCHLLGHSMGGMVTLRFALEHPQRVSSAIFMDTAPCRPEALRREVLERAGELAMAEGMAELQARVEKAGRARSQGSAGEWDVEDYWAHHQRRYAQMDPRSYLELGLAMTDQTSLVPRLPELDCEALVIVGDGDADFLPGADLFEAHLPRATRVTIPDAGHHPHRENRRAWLEAVEDHLRRAG